jgi:GT2 family glycosyltransferase
MTAWAHRVAVVVLTWNGRSDTLDCIASVKESQWPALDIIVVDNGSSDGTPSAVRELHPDVELLVNDANLGYAEGNNVGINYALTRGADYVFILNNDALVAPYAIRHLVAEAERRGDAGALCPIIYFADEPHRIWFAGATFDPWRGRSGRMTAYRELDSGHSRDSVQIDRATGTAMLVPRRTLETVGMLDGRLFLYYEDVDWSLRMRHEGLPIYLVPAAKVWHRVSRTAGGEHVADSVYYATRNHLTVLARHAPLRGVPNLRRQLSAVAVQMARVRFSDNPPQHFCAVLEGWWDFSRGRFGPRRSASSHRYGSVGGHRPL